MADLTLSALQSADAESTGEVWLTLIRIKDADGTVLLRLVINTESVIANGDVYLPMLADISISEQDGSRPSEVSLSLDAVDRTIVQALSSLTRRPLVDVDLILASDPNTPLEQKPDMELVGYSLQDARLLSARLEGPRYFEEMIPAVLMDPVNTPAIFP